LLARTEFFARDEVLPLRLEIARSYESMITAFRACAKSPGEIETIASIESGCRARVISGHDPAMAQVLGVPLPAEAAISTAYRGTPRNFVSTRRTQMKAGQPQEIRASTLSANKCAGVNLLCHPPGAGRFRKTAATHRARQACWVDLPVGSQSTVEYCLEAALENGQKLVWPATAPAINQTVTAW